LLLNYSPCKSGHLAHILMEILYSYSFDLSSFRFWQGYCCKSQIIPLVWVYWRRPKLSGQMLMLSQANPIKYYQCFSVNFEKVLLMRPLFLEGDWRKGMHIVDSTLWQGQSHSCSSRWLNARKFATFWENPTRSVILKQWLR